MKRVLGLFVNALVEGFLAILPIYLTILLLLKAMKSLGSFVRPLTHVTPKWFPAGGEFLAKRNEWLIRPCCPAFAPAGAIRQALSAARQS